MLDIGTVKTSVYARWPKELNFDEVLELEVLGEKLDDKLDDKDLAEKFGGDRVEFVNRHSWEV